MRKPQIVRYPTMGTDAFNATNALTLLGDERIIARSHRKSRHMRLRYVVCARSSRQLHTPIRGEGRARR